jgi:hypothetical protein
MTRSQFALAVLADEKWVENATRLLNRRLKYSAADARWLGLVRVLNQEVGLTLVRAAQLADEALRHQMTERFVVVGRREDESAGVSIDLARFHSTRATALSAALDMGGARRRGRRRTMPAKISALERAARYGIDIDLLREGLQLSPRKRLEQLDENAAFIRAIRPVRS